MNTTARYFDPVVPRAAVLVLAWAASAAPARAADFEKDVRPLLAARCGSCHGEKKQKGHLRLDLRADALKGGEGGPAIVPGKPDQSPLLRRVASRDDGEMMPPTGDRLSDKEVAVLREWTEAGAKWPDDGSAADTFAAAKGHWAFIPPKKADVPAGAHPIDHFLAAKHRELGLTPVGPADRRTLIRRLTLDLTGLPPTPEEVEAFVADASPDAYAKVVDRLLASPRYGERWGRFWLDLARWAESDGYEANDLRPSAWRYRDWVVTAFNADLPYDRFLREQLAGDELTPYSDANLIATGFLAAGRTNNNEEDKVVQLNEPLVDVANTVASVALGLTLGCAQCHDHKFEALSIRDYYAWHGLFLRGQVNSLALTDPALIAEWEKTPPPELATAKKLLAELTDPKRPPPAADSDDAKFVAELKKQVAAWEKKRTQSRPHTWGFFSPATSPHPVQVLPTRGQYPFSYKPDALKAAKPVVLKRGNPATRGDPVEPAAPTVLGGAKLGTRRELADWLAGDANPLTARVWVNYVWQQHFGRGLVETPGDFGVKGARPTSQPLLDWLAVEFRERGWSTKHLHRLIVTSDAYRRASEPHAGNAAKDPDNRHLWRWRPRRLEGEAVRDSLLAVAGKLDATAGGPSADVAKAPSFRRSLYLVQHRYQLPPLQAVFDAPTGNESCPRRHTSTVPLQPLALLNNPECVGLARAFAARVAGQAGVDPDKRIDAAYRLALGRPPRGEEITAVKAFLADAKDPDALFRFAQVLLNANEFLYLD
ncbi:MAG: PSD1 and planctomycete cytochrome C domain-containing protein [Gemmataceae bacterium]|nr:PSD1 and planctomycete cytochrome C domain-containing protein [Gemmataceae bacterium]